jgi:putative ABC transport system ATP-binding protein
MDVVVQLNNVTKVYIMGDQRLEALKGISFSVRPGEFVAIMGASGSGKSTCMNILGCLDVPTSGEYRLEDVNVGELSRNELAEIRNRKLGFVFQGFNLLARTNARENVELPLVYARIPAAARRAKAMAALAQVGLAERADHYSNQLSGGQQQRVAIARALVNEPAIIMADEPTGNLDSQTSEEIMGIFQKLNSHGITIIMVTHEPDIAAFTGRQIIFRDGLIISDTLNTNQRVSSTAPGETS